jgi:hypothetical protein
MFNVAFFDLQVMGRRAEQLKYSIVALFIQRHKSDKNRQKQNVLISYKKTTTQSIENIA